MIEVVAKKHFPRDLRVARLIGSKQRQVAQAVKVDDDEGQKN